MISSDYLYGGLDRETARLQVDLFTRKEIKALAEIDEMRDDFDLLDFSQAQKDRQLRLDKINKAILFCKEQIQEGQEVLDMREDVMEKQVGGGHYRDHAIQSWDIIDEYGLNFYEGNMLKYLLREKGNRIEDLEKLIHYAEKELINLHKDVKTTAKELVTQKRVTAYDSRFTFPEEYRELEIDIAAKLREGSYNNWMLHGFDEHGYAAIVNSETTRIVLAKDFEEFEDYLKESAIEVKDTTETITMSIDIADFKFPNIEKDVELTYGEHEMAKEQGKEDSSVEAWIQGSELIMRERDDENRIVINLQGTRDVWRFRTYVEFFKWLTENWNDLIVKNGPYTTFPNLNGHNDGER